MKLTRNIAILLLGLFFAVGCTVSNPSSEDIFPMMKAASTQMFIVGQFYRWTILTNTKTPYKISAAPSMSNYSDILTRTNITYGGTTNTNITKTTNKYAILFVSISDRGNMGYTYTADLKFYLAKGILFSQPTNYMNFTNTAHFAKQYTNAIGCNLTGKIVYRKGGIVLTTIFSNVNLYSGGATTKYYNNQINGQSDFNSTNGVMKSYFAVEGSMTTSAKTYPFKYVTKTGFKVSFLGNTTNSYENISGSISGFLSTTKYNYYYETGYSGDSSFVITLKNIEKYSGTVSMNLTTGN